MNRTVKDALVHTAVFAAFGPPGGAVAVLATVLIFGGHRGSLTDFAAGLPFIFLALLASYIFGIIPAALTGLASFLLRAIPTFGVWVVANMLAGMGIAAIALVALSKDGWASPNLATEAAMFGALGMIGAILPSLVLGKSWADFQARPRA